MSDFEIKTVIPFAPLGRNVVVQLQEHMVESESGLILDQAHSLVAEEIPVGIVVAVGPEAPDFMEPGMGVILRKYTGTQLVIGDDLYNLYDVGDVLGVVLETPEA
jgi:co-chaperonin GroES (HSP10)